MSIKSKIAALEKVKIHYQYMGEGAPIIFLHGFPEFSYEWRKQLEHFSKTHLAIAPDLRGYNLSSKPEGVDQYAVAALAQDVKDLCDHLHLKKIVLVGHDWGGIVAWAFAYLYPEYLDKLVILNAPYPAIYNHQIKANPTQQKAAEYILLLRRATAAKILSRNNFEWLSGWVLNKGLVQGTLTEADKQAYVNAWSQPGALEAMLNYYRALNLDMNEDKTPDWSRFALAPEVKMFTQKIQVPTLVIWGEQDEALVSENLAGLDQFVENLQIQRLPECGHFLVHEHPNQINQLIDAFLVE